MQPKELTRAEEQVMQYLWVLGKAYLKDIVEKFPEPRPAYTTVSTVIRVLVKKEFIGYTSRGKVNEYRPLISKNDYLKRRLKPIISNYFSGSRPEFASFFANEQLNLFELEEIRELIEEKIKKLKSKKK
ncbi:MAG: BlaI/MecI/CopY family transcriptional regulator [Bacteroidetes bacterium]|nr:BlaI/MecI/CopY family transcriptional regulator [Bacteroidota bacterium]